MNVSLRFYLQEHAVWQPVIIALGVIWAIHEHGSNHANDILTVSTTAILHNLSFQIRKTFQCSTQLHFL